MNIVREAMHLHRIYFKREEKGANCFYLTKRTLKINYALENLVLNYVLLSNLLKDNSKATRSM